MTGLVPGEPEPPAWRIDWTAIEAALPALLTLADCPQDPRHHAEGDVLTHTRLAAETLVTLPAFRERPAEERAILFLATLLHDIAKPAVTRIEPDGSIVAPGHSRRGAILARTILWRLGVPFAAREQIAALIRHHQRPFHLIDDPDSQRLAITASQTARCDLLAILAEADARGRICFDLDRLLENIALFRELCRDEQCLDQPYRFASDHARFSYFRSPGRDPRYPAYDDTRCEVVLLSGLPGAGKNHWLTENLSAWPVIGLDDLREQLGIRPTEPQGRVVQEARERARSYLRAGQSFVWNATNLSRQIRGLCIDLFADYRARIRIVYREVPADHLARQNAERLRAVPEAAMSRLLDRWEVPDLTECHQIDYVVTR